MKFLYLCNVKEKIRNLKPAWATKIPSARGMYFLGKVKNGDFSEISNNNLQFYNLQLNNLLTL